MKVYWLPRQKHQGMCYFPCDSWSPIRGVTGVYISTHILTDIMALYIVILG